AMSAAASLRRWDGHCAGATRRATSRARATTSLRSLGNTPPKDRRTPGPHLLRGRGVRSGQLRRRELRVEEGAELHEGLLIHHELGRDVTIGPAAHVSEHFLPNGCILDDL